MVLPNPLSLPPVSIFLGVIKIWEFLTWLKVDLVFTILNVMCECVSAALEQVAGNRPVYVLGGFGCAMVAIGFAVGELLWMKKKNQNIGILDLLGFLAALSQVSSSGLHVVFVCLHKSSPINFSVFSLIFALVSSYYKIIWKSRTHEFVIYCKEGIHCQSLKVCEEIHPTKTLFECPRCANFNGGYGEYGVQRVFNIVYGVQCFFNVVYRVQRFFNGGDGEFFYEKESIDGDGEFFYEKESIDGDEEFFYEQESIDNKKDI